jgi:hypothetical protein
MQEYQQKSGFLQRQIAYYALTLPISAQQIYRKITQLIKGVSVTDLAKASLTIPFLTPATFAATAPVNKVYEAEQPSEKQKQIAAANISLLEQTLAGTLSASENTIWTPWRGFLGATAGNHYDGFSGEALIPLKEHTSNDLPFLYIFGGADFDLKDWNAAAGVGYRFFQGNSPVFGINAFWGVDDTKNTSQWTRLQGEVFGLGRERNIEANASYKWTLQDKELTKQLRTDDMITRRYESLLEGFHGEVGIWHPTLENIATGVFPGYGKYQGDKEGFTGRIEFDAGKAILSIDYSDIPDARGWFISLKIPFGDGPARKPKLYQSNPELLRELVRFQRHVYGSRVTQERIERRSEQQPPKDIPPPPFADPRPKMADIYNQTLVGARSTADQYVQNVLGFDSSTQKVKAEHPHNEAPGQIKKNPPPTPFALTKESIDVRDAGWDKPNPHHGSDWMPPGQAKKEPPAPPF